jgi:hypothetical protein
MGQQENIPLALCIFKTREPASRRIFCTLTAAVAY